jgi:hypothetical protein
MRTPWIKMRTPLLEKVFTEIENEVGAAIRKHPEFPSLHHAISVIREEYLELEREVFTDSFDSIKIRKEAIQVCATCIRLLIDL